MEGKEAVTTEVVEKAENKVIRIGTKPAETTVEIPKGLDYELDYSRKDGDPEVVEEGNNGVVTIKTTRDPQTGEIIVTKTTTIEAKNKKIKIPAGTEGTHEYTEKKPFTYDIQFDPDFYKNYPDAKDNYKIVTEGKVGEKTTKWTIKNSEIVGEPEIIKDTDPTNAVIKVGQKDYTGTITHTESHEVPFEVEYRYSNELEVGQTKIEQKGEKGSYDVEYSQKIKNGEKDGELTSTKKNEKAAKKEIIVIGTKPVVKEVEKPFNTEYQYDENMDAGKEEEVTKGVNGKVTTTTSYDEDQKKVITDEKTEEPTNRVVKVGVKPVVKEEAIPNNTEYKHNPELKAGETKKIKDGTPGKVTITTTFNKETGKLETKVERTEPTNAEYEYGSKTTGEVKVKSEIPYEVEIIEDNTMDAGTHKVDQEGEKGEKETTIVIENSVEKSRTDKTTKEAKKKIIRVGTKPNKNMCPVPEQPSNPNKPNDGNPYVPSTPGKEGPSKPGEENPSTPGKHDPSKPGHDDPSNPSGDQSTTPGKDDPMKPGHDNPSDDPSKSGKENPSKPDDGESATPGKKDASDNTSNPSDDEESKRPGAQAIDEESESKPSPAVEEERHRVKEGAKAPQTFDPGIAAPTGLGALASGLLIGLERLKRKNRK